jgi:hypothetical protein
VPPGGGALNAGPPGGAVTADGSFSFTEVTPGRYRIQYVRSRQWIGAWWIAAVVANGHDIFDAPFVVVPDEDTELVVAFSDHPSGITGSLQDASGRPATDYFIVVFPADRARWEGQFSVRNVRPASDGRFEVRGLRPGEYLLAALTDLQTEDLYAPRFFDALVPMAVPVPVRDGAMTTKDLRVGGRTP